MPDLATTLDAVTVFPDRARVTRRGQWKLTLAPAAKQTVQFEFSVEFPRTMDVVGLA